MFHWTQTERDAFREGKRDIFSGGIANSIWGFVTGVALIKSSLTLGQAVGMTLLVYAGSAQLAVLPLMMANLPIWIVCVTASIVNLRFVIFSAGIQPHFKKLPFWQRLWVGYLNGDLPFILFIKRYPEESDDKLRLPYFLGLSINNWIAWQFGSLAGIFFAGFLPDSWGLGFAGTLALIAIVMPVVDHGNAMIAAITAAVVALLAVGLPYKLNLVLAVLAAIIVGVALDLRKTKTPQLAAQNDKTIQSLEKNSQTEQS